MMVEGGVPAGIYLFVALTIGGPQPRQDYWMVPKHSVEQCNRHRRKITAEPIRRDDGSMRRPGLYMECLDVKERE